MSTEERTPAGLPVRPAYGSADLRPVDDPGTPGAYPFQRGIRERLYQNEPWVMGMYSGQASPAETNRRIRSLVAQGQKGFSIALDLPTQMGLDPDDPLAKGEVGRVGVPIASARDMEALLAGIPLDQVRQIRSTANSIGPIMLAWIVVAAERNGYRADQFRVMLQNDSLKEYVARGTFIFPPRHGLDFSVDVIEHCARHLRHWEPIEFCGYHIRDSGATAVQEVAIAIGHAREYIDATIRRGLGIDEFAHSLFIFLSASIDLFEEVAKFRATRRLWSALMRDHYGASNEESWKLNIFAYTLGSQLTLREPLNNVARVAYETLAAVLGGAQTIATSSFDEALGLPTDEAVRVALRTQQIAAYETGVTRVTDPLGGSYFVERLTTEFAEAVTAYLARIREHGGGLAALESGWTASEIDDSAYRLQRAIDDGERVVVGVNRFRQEGKDAVRGMPTASAEVEREQLVRLAELRRTRDAAAVARTLAAVRDAAAHRRNTVEPIIDAVRADTTIGEICGVLKQEWGGFRKPW